MYDVSKWHWFGLFLLVVGVFYFFYYFSGYEFTLSEVQKNATELYQFVQNHYGMSLCVFSLFFIIATVCFIPVTVLLSVVAGFLFGVGLGTALAVLSATIGSCIIFLIIRYFVGQKIQKKYATKLKSFNRDIEKYGAYYLLFLQLLPVTPTFVINVGAGLSKMSLFTFFWATALGIVPGTFIYAFAGQQLHTIDSLENVFSIPVLMFLIGLALLVLVVRFIVNFYMNSTP